VLSNQNAYKFQPSFLRQGLVVFGIKWFLDPPSKIKWPPAGPDFFKTHNVVSSGIPKKLGGGFWDFSIIDNDE
jgi:hypothetical protein